MNKFYVKGKKSNLDVRGFAVADGRMNIDIMRLCLDSKQIVEIISLDW